MASQGLRCFAWVFSSCHKLGLLFAAVWPLFEAVCGLLPAAASHCRVQARGLRELQHTAGAAAGDSEVVVHRINRSACETLLDQGLNPCPLHWQADSNPMCHQGSLKTVILKQLCHVSKSFYIEYFYKAVIRKYTTVSCFSPTSESFCHVPCTQST